MKKYDICVLGGGFAGVAAAISASKNGCKVLLVEKGNSLGGAAVNSLVNPFMPNSTVINGEKVELSAGFFRIICEKLKTHNALKGSSFLEEELKYILNEMFLENNIDILFHAYLCNVQKDDEKIQSVSVATINGIMDIKANYFIDATGDAQVAFLANCPISLGRKEDNLCQPMTLCFRIGNVDKEKFKSSRKALNEAYKKALENGELINPREDILLFNTPIDNVIHCNTTRVVKLNPVLVEDVSKAEIIARKQVFEVYEFMKKYADGLENSFLMMTAPEIGVRESRRIIGDYILTVDDCKSCTKFHDAIAACNYDIDIHNPEGSGTSHYFFKEGEYYTIPYRCLIPQKVTNMLVAGRSISSDHESQASYRIMPSICCIGEAAGTAISIAAKNKSNVRSVNIKELQQKLKSNGAFIGI